MNIGAPEHIHIRETGIRPKHVLQNCKIAPTCHFGELSAPLEYIDCSLVYSKDTYPSNSKVFIKSSRKSMNHFLIK